MLLSQFNARGKQNKTKNISKKPTSMFESLRWYKKGAHKKKNLQYIFEACAKLKKALAFFYSVKKTKLQLTTNSNCLMVNDEDIFVLHHKSYIKVFEGRRALLLSCQSNYMVNILWYYSILCDLTWFIGKWLLAATPNFIWIFVKFPDLNLFLFVRKY